MSVSKTEAKTILIYNGSNIFAVNDIDISSADQKIYIQVFDSNNVLKDGYDSSDLEVGVDYTISDLNTITGNFNVNWISTKILTIGDKVVIFRDGNEIISDIFNNNNIIQLTSRNFDKVCRLIQELKDRLDRTLSFNRTDIGVQVPDIIVRKDTMPYFDKDTGELTFIPKISLSLDAVNLIKDNNTSGNLFTWSIDKLQSMFSTVYTTITNGLNTKVDKVTGYALSKNDLTDILKTNYDDANTKKHTHTNKAVLDTITKELSTVAVSGSYNDLSNTPIIGSIVYSVNSAKTTNGLPTFINANGNNSQIDFDTNSGNTPVVCCYPDGTIESNASLTSITGISTNANPFYIIKEKGSNTYVTTIEPLEQYTAPTSPATGQLWLDISVKPYLPKKWNGSAWIATQFVKLGKFPRSSNIIGTITNYALNGTYKYYRNNIPASGIGNIVTLNDNLGFSGTLLTLDLDIICLVGNNGYQVGEVIQNPRVYQADGPDVTPLQKLNNIITTLYLGSTGLYISSKADSSSIGLSNTSNWGLAINIKRNF